MAPQYGGHRIIHVPIGDTTECFFALLEGLRSGLNDFPGTTYEERARGRSTSGSTFDEATPRQVLLAMEREHFTPAYLTQRLARAELDDETEPAVFSFNEYPVVEVSASFLHDAGRSEVAIRTSSPVRAQADSLMVRANDIVAGLPTYDPLTETAPGTPISIAPPVPAPAPTRLDTPGADADDEVRSGHPGRARLALAAVGRFFKSPLGVLILGVAGAGIVYWLGWN